MSLICYKNPYEAREVNETLMVYEPISGRCSRERALDTTLQKFVQAKNISDLKSSKFDPMSDSRLLPKRGSS